MTPEKSAERAQARDKFNAFLDGVTTRSPGVFQSWKNGFDEFLGDFLRGQFVIKKPRVLRSSPAKLYGVGLEDRTVVVIAHFAFTRGQISVRPDHLGVWVTRDQTGQLVFDTPHFPHILEEYDIHLGTAMQVLGNPGREEFFRVIHEALGPRWVECQQQLIQEIRRIDRDIHQIVQDHITKYSVKERKALQKKLSTLLEKSQGLVDAPPEAIFEFYKISPDEIKKFAGHVKRNPNDVEVVELEDIVEAQNQARVRKVMTA